MAKKTKKQALTRSGRVEREERQQKMVIHSTIVLLGVVIILIIAGAIYFKLILPNRVIATVNGEEILAGQYQERLEYERILLSSQYDQLFQAYYTTTEPSTQAYFLNQMNLLEFQLDPVTIGNAILNAMIEEAMIRQEAEELGIIVTDEDVTVFLGRYMGYGPDGFPTATIAPTMIPTNPLSEEQLALVTLTPTPTELASSTPEATAEDEAEETEEESEEPTPFPTLAPTLAPTSITLDEFETLVNEYVTQWDISESFLQDYIYNQILRDRVSTEITAGLPHTQNMVWAREILIESEDLANEAYQRLLDGEDWNLILEVYTLNEEQILTGGDMGWISITGREPSVIQVLFNTSIGNFTEPYLDAVGWHIAQVLGHEDYPLTAQEYNQFQIDEFDSWITSLEAHSEIVIADDWQTYILDQPSPLYLGQQ